MNQYSFNGMRRLRTPNGIGEIDCQEHEAFKKMETLEQQEKWEELAEFCHLQIVQNAEWLTPYFYAGFAYGHIPGKFAEALRLFKYVAVQSGDDPAYIQARKISKAFTDLHS